MSKSPPWKTRLAPFAAGYAAYYRDHITGPIEAMTDDELQKLLIDCRQPDQGNCWWATYQVAKVLAPEASGELYRRNRRNKAKEADS